jgi:hypothetical protein
LLVAMFNLSQGKEFAGLERAIGSAMFATGRARADDQGRMAHLIESQERCLAICAEFATPGRLACLPLDETPEAIAELERLRRVLLGAEADAPLACGRDAQWFDCCSRRVDEMRRAEERFCDQLRRLCRDKVAAARSDLAACATLVAAAASARGGSGPPSTAVSFFDDPEVTNEPGAALEPATRTLGPLLERSVLDLVREQSQRLQSTRAELDAVRATLNERKVIERAKGLLMAHRQLGEDQAHKAMRQMAMNQNRRLIDVAEAVLTMADLLAVATPPSAARPR